MIYKSNIATDRDGQEILPNKKNSFPYICQIDDMNSYVEHTINWHWHPSLEIDYVAEGEAEVRTPDAVLHLKKGQAVFINTNVMHMLRSADTSSDCFVVAHIFDRVFLAGIYNSIFDQKYLLPIISNENLGHFLIVPDNRRKIRMLEKILNLTDLSKEEPFGYEFQIRAELSSFWCELLQETVNIQKLPQAHDNVDMDRIKQMIQYIHTHYMERISIEDIASAASIGVRECSRCFRRSIQTTPNKFLTEYRIRVAAQALVQTNDSILKISEDCGFSSGSYFGKTFFAEMKCTPREYRQKNR